MEDRQSLPDINRLSVLTSTILLAYAVSIFISIPERDFVLTFPGMAVFTFQFDFSVLVSILVAALAATGTDWLLRAHPKLSSDNILQHEFLPALTAWVIGIPLNEIVVGVQWWVVFGFGGILLALVFVAEYIVVDLSDQRHEFAAIGLTAVSFALYLFQAIALRGAGLRLYLLFPSIIITMAFVSLRTLYLRLNGRWCVGWSISIALIVGQIAVGLHYFPISPLSYGLMLLGPAYALTSIAGAIEESRPWRVLWIEPLIMLCIMWVLAIIIG